MKERMQGYNRKDYYYARSAREAFGSEYYVEEENPVGVSKSLQLIVLGIFIFVLVCIWGVM